MLSSDPGYAKLAKCIDEGKNGFRIIQKRSQKRILIVSTDSEILFE